MSKTRALISVSDKANLLPLATELVSAGFEIISTGGTFKMLQEAGIEVTEVSSVTGFPESPGGLVKTLHPKIHFGLLMDRENSEHKSFAAEHGIVPIDIVVCNLYPFKEAAKKEGIGLDELKEEIDIGGVAMIRAAAKNFQFVTVLTNPADYDLFIEKLKKGLTEEDRQYFSVKAFEHTADYDAAINVKLSERMIGEKVLRLKFGNGCNLRYGENSHQKATFYANTLTEEANIGHYKQHHGKELSFNNFVDANASLEACKELPSDKPATVIVKHTIQCGMATGETLAESFERAWQGDPISAFGSVVTVNRPLDLATAKLFDGRFLELIIAPSFTKEALEYLNGNSKKKDLRVLEVGDFGRPNPKFYDYKCIVGGILEQTRDLELFEKWEDVTEAKFPENKKALAEFAIFCVKHIKSNDVVLVREYKQGLFQLLGLGSGQPNRVDSLARLAVPKALDNLKREFEDLKLPGKLEDYQKTQLAECVMASEAFFPFRDTIDACAGFGLKYVIQPGGSVKDQDSIDAANEHGIAMVFTGMRHFRH
ncbi:MAG: bifunctional phosphoribosylaminoimidazolecarboxamide formyltransferase/IMP cyclohydrolase [Candidatus Gracilibacteria bacterium]|nr:bifunctional phosphoribosylaminoimidazolecarboxamide formyltransferase/IMP cyclohydrolase [Candidatus Gracilibacteria bacterium]